MLPLLKTIISNNVRLPLNKQYLYYTRYFGETLIKYQDSKLDVDLGTIEVNIQVL